MKRERRTKLTAAELKAAGVSKERVVRLVRREEPKESEPARREEERGNGH